MKRYRDYWRNPRLADELSEEQRKKVIERFFRLLKKSEGKES